MNYSVKAGGKRLRPILMREVYRLFGGQGKEIEPLMAAIEMIHTSSLIHDDLPCMDNDEYRRGKKTTWVAYGYDMAVLAGDALLIYAIETAAKAFAMTPDAAKVGRCIQILSEKTGIYGMIGGQIMDIEGEKRKLSQDEVFRLQSLKTGALISAASVMGALAAGVRTDDPAMERVVRYAENIGLVFQIVDDLLDRHGDEATLGKRVHVDEEHHKNTFLSFCTEEEAWLYAERLTADACRAIRLYPSSEILVSLAEWLLKREK